MASRHLIVKQSFIENSKSFLEILLNLALLYIFNRPMALIHHRFMVNDNKLNYKLIII